MKELGIEPSIILAQIVNFGLLVAVLYFLLYKPFISYMQKKKHEEIALEKTRQKLEAEQAELTETMRKEHASWEDRLKKQEEEFRKELTSARAEILSKAKVRAEEIVRKAKVTSSEK